MATERKLLWAPRAWLPGGWRENVLLEVGADGNWASITTDLSAAPDGAEVLAGPALPGLVDAHSHAFQRAFAGLAERRESAADDFWSWRDRMYGVALRIGPEALRAVAAQLALELLHGGYTQLVEFHYLQHRVDGRRYDDPLTMGWAIADGAAEAGIGLTLMPAIYERAGFRESTLRDDQRRFRAGADDVWAAARTIAASGRPMLDAGLVIHSLRAAAPQSIHRLRELAADFAGPIHVHVAEQTAEVDDCVAATGQRPIEWLAGQQVLDARWQLVHATHVVPAEVEAVAASGAGVVICPTTEANLGDGLTDVVGWLDQGVPIAIGSDSHVARDVLEELRWLEYGQRLTQRRRNVAAAPESGQPSTAARLFDRIVSGGGQAAGRSRWGLLAGARADLLVADPQSPALLGMPPSRCLDALVFSSPSAPWRDVMVAGSWVIREHAHPGRQAIATRFAQAVTDLWDGPA
ncbi:formimidoylglutamate deiminase [Piscinibacter sakaiensis]|uniref:formimidoylglutamate deiminase n=1 Tax=Piscinibacter sakaiensis TaxID=1547922 RepID=UPI003AAF4D24